MASLFEDVFNELIVYESLFFNIKSVLIYPTLDELKEKNPAMYERWKYISKLKYGFDMDVKHSEASAMQDLTPIYAQKTYEENASHFPEYCKIVAITYANLYYEDRQQKRFFKKIVNDDEYLVIATFMDVLYQISSEGAKSNPQQFPALCGYNIISSDIPLLIKRFLVHRDKFVNNNKQLPYILKRALSVKPWESGVIDIVNVWKFNGFDNMPLMLIADYLGLKKTTDLLSVPELSQYYWQHIADTPKETLEFIALQSATQTNLVIQLINMLREH